MKEPVIVAVEEETVMPALPVLSTTVPLTFIIAELDATIPWLPPETMLSVTWRVEPEPVTWSPMRMVSSTVMFSRIAAPPFVTDTALLTKSAP